MIKKKILIVEDEEGLAEEWQTGFRHEGCDTHIVTSVDEVRAVLDKLDFDLVILDVLLPTMDEPAHFVRQIRYGRTAGIWCAKEMKGRRPDLPIIVVTVVTDEKIISKLKNMGVDHVLSKPCTVEDLLRCAGMLHDECES